MWRYISVLYMVVVVLTVSLHIRTGEISRDENKFIGRVYDPEVYDPVPGM